MNIESFFYILKWAKLKKRAIGQLHLWPINGSSFWCYALINNTNEQLNFIRFY